MPVGPEFILLFLGLGVCACWLFVRWSRPGSRRRRGAEPSSRARPESPESKPPAA